MRKLSGIFAALLLLLSACAPAAVPTGEAIELTPNVTLRLDRANRAVFYYGCVDRPTK